MQSAGNASLPSPFGNWAFCMCFWAATAWSAMAGEAPSRLAGALHAAMDTTIPEKDRLVAIRRLGEADFERVSSTLAELISPRHPNVIRIAAVKALGEIAEPKSVELLLADWTHQPAPLKHQVLEALTGRSPLAREFVAQLERAAIPLADVDSATRQRLANFPDADISTRAGKLFDRQPWLDAKAAFQRFKSALEFKGDAVRGKEVFKERTCVNCHRIGDEGHFVGADLFTIKDMGRDELLQHIVAPNLFFMPTFQAFVAETADGELLEGVVAGTTETTVTIRQATGIDRVFNKSSLKRLKGLNVSLMPEGLLEGLSPQQVADLLEFIRSLRGF